MVKKRDPHCYYHNGLLSFVIRDAKKIHFNFKHSIEFLPFLSATETG